MDGVKLRAVNWNRLTPKQRAQIRVIETLGKKFGIEFRLFESSLGKNGRYQSAYGMYKDGVIYLDVNAGRLGQSMGQVALVRTAAHELTHYIQDYAEERYQELQEFLLDYLVEWKGKDLGQLVAEKMQRDRTGKLTPEEALDEVVADGCEMMLRRTKVMQAMAEQKPGLFQAVKEWMQEWIQAVKEAFLGVSDVHDEARAVAQMETERLEKLVELWDKGLMEASERAAKSPAREGGAVRYQAVDSYGNVVVDQNVTPATVKDTLQQIYDGKTSKKGFTFPILKNTPSVFTEYCHLDGDRSFVMHSQKALKAMQNKLKGQHALGVDGLMKVIDKLKEPDYIILQNVGENAGHYVAIITIEKGETVAAVDLGNYRGGENAVGGENGYYNVLITAFVADDGYIDDTLFDEQNDVVFDKEKDEIHDPVALGDSPTGQNQYTSSDNSIPASEGKSNTKNQERDELPDDRALLMQARAEGRNAEALTAYQKKVRSLETLERKLRRQQDGLEEARQHEVVDQEGKPLPPEEQKKLNRETMNAVQEQIRKTEDSIRRAEKALADMERKPEMRQEMEKALHTGRPLVPSGYPLHRKAAFGRLLLSFPFHTSRRDSTPILYSLFPCKCKTGVTPRKA